jgi:RNA polymerase sigma factor (sigma-70 family)
MMEGDAWAFNRTSRETPLTDLSTAFDDLFKAEYPRVVRIASRVLGDQAEAEEVAQEAFLAFHKQHSPLAPYAPAWLHSAATHGALNRLRANRRRSRREMVAAPAEGENTTDPGDAVAAAEDRDNVRRALRRIPGKSARVLALRYSGLSYAEVAQAMGVGIGQVGTLLRRAEARLLKEVTR